MPAGGLNPKLGFHLCQLVIHRSRTGIAVFILQSHGLISNSDRLDAEPLAAVIECAGNKSKPVVIGTAQVAPIRLINGVNTGNLIGPGAEACSVGNGVPLLNLVQVTEESTVSALGPVVGAKPHITVPAGGKIEMRHAVVHSLHLINIGFVNAHIEIDTGDGDAAVSATTSS